MARSCPPIFQRPAARGRVQTRPQDALSLRRRGPGNVIQFARYIPLLRDPDQVTVECHADLTSLMVEFRA